MPQLNQEANILLALQALENDPSLSIRCAASTYNVCSKTLGRRHKAVLSPCNTPSNPNSRKLSDPEEDSIVRLMFDLEARGFSPQLHTIEETANRLLANRDAPPVGKCWASNFVRRHPHVQTCILRKRQSQSSKCDDIAVIRSWFELVKHQITEYRILLSDIYSYEETGFIIGSISSGVAVTGAERRRKAKSAQPKNTEWATSVQAVNSEGWVVAPFIVVAGQYHLAKWREESKLPDDWAISLTHNGCSDHNTSLKWLTHFDEHTKTQKRGRYRLLILDRDASHHSSDFETYCKESDIITVCTPPNSSHWLQPLNVGCRGPLKRSYSREIEHLARSSTTRITKTDFFSAFYAAQKAVVTEDVIKEAFRKAGLAPWDPQAVISKLDTQPQASTSVEEANLPSPSASILPTPDLTTNSQPEHPEEEIRRDQNGSPASIVEAVKSLANETKSFINEITLMRSEFRDLREATETLSKQYRGKRARLQSIENVAVEEESEENDQVDVDMQIQAESSRG